MDNGQTKGDSQPQGDNQAHLQHNDQSAHQDKGLSHAFWQQADVDSAKAAWEAWKSNDPHQWDLALTEKDRILHSDPKAWTKAMKEIDIKEQEEAKIAELQRELQAEEAARAAAQAQSAIAPPVPDSAAAAAPAALPSDQTAVAAPADQTASAQVNQQPDVIVVGHPGYGDTPLSPPPPNSPAYDIAYNHQEPFHGLDLGILRIGHRGNSFDIKANIGLASGELQLGQNNRVDGEFMPVGGPLHARVGGGVGFNQNGVHVEAGAGANVFGLVNADGDGGGYLGNGIGVNGDVRGRALVVNGHGAADASIGQQGLKVEGGGNADVAHIVGGTGGASVGLGPDGARVAAGAGPQIGPSELHVGPSIEIGNAGIVPKVDIDANGTGVTPFYPTGDSINPPTAPTLGIPLTDQTQPQ